jgi:hypothetical protein
MLRIATAAWRGWKSPARHAWTVNRLGFRVQVWVLALVTTDPTWELKCGPACPNRRDDIMSCRFFRRLRYNDEPFKYTALSGKSLEMVCGFPACRGSFATYSDIRQP